MEGDPSDGGPVLSYPHKSDVYMYRVPTPPRIALPPPTLNSDAIPDISLHALPSTGYEFLQHVNYDNLVKRNAPIEWTYEQRRDAQPILPFLWLGPMTVAKDETWLQQQGITMLMGVRQKHAFGSKLMNSIMHAAERRSVEHHTLDLASNQDLIQAFPGTTSIINEHLARQFHETGQQGKVLVFCESGNERAAGIVAAYIMEMHEDVDYIKAMQLCQAQRFCVNFNDNMKRLLQGYWDILCARRTVAVNMGMQSSNSLPTKLRTKRELDRTDDGEAMQTDSDTTEADDIERFRQRSFAPFVDTPF